MHLDLIVGPFVPQIQAQHTYLFVYLWYNGTTAACCRRVNTVNERTEFWCCVRADSNRHWKTAELCTYRHCVCDQHSKVCCFLDISGYQSTAALSRFIAVRADRCDNVLWSQHHGELLCSIRETALCTRKGVVFVPWRFWDVIWPVAGQHMV